MEGIYGRNDVLGREARQNGDVREHVAAIALVRGVPGRIIDKKSASWVTRPIPNGVLAEALEEETGSVEDELAQIAGVLAREAEGSDTVPRLVLSDGFQGPVAHPSYGPAYPKSHEKAVLLGSFGRPGKKNERSGRVYDVQISTRRLIETADEVRRSRWGYLRDRDSRVSAENHSRRKRQDGATF